MKLIVQFSLDHSVDASEVWVNVIMATHPYAVLPLFVLFWHPISNIRDGRQTGST